MTLYCHRHPAHRGGFTLFEVLGAVTILAIVYAWLATSAMQGMRSEGLSKRRLEASLRIDQELMALETDLATGVVPPVGHTEQDLDGGLFRLVLDVTPFDPSPYLEVAGEDFLPEGATSTLLMPPERPEDAFLRIVDMRLRWDEAGDEFEVRRTTLVQDQAQIAELFPDTQGQAPEATEEPKGNDISVEALKNLLQGMQK